MNIVYLSNSIIPSINANSVQVVKTCEALARVGNKVELVARYPKSNEGIGQKEINKFYGVNGPFKVKHFSWPSIRLIGGLLYSNMIYKYLKSGYTIPHLYNYFQ